MVGVIGRIFGHRDAGGPAAPAHGLPPSAVRRDAGVEEATATPLPNPLSTRRVDDVIRELVPGRSFADLGGLWGTVNEKVTVAALAGAARCAMLDHQPEGTDPWRRFDERAGSLGVGGYRSARVDLNDPLLADKVGTYDVVHCSGVIYHCPDPYRALRQLRSIALDRVILVSMTVPERIENRCGVLDFAGGRVVAVPAMDERARAVAAEHFGSLGLQAHNINMDTPHPWTFSDGEPNYAPWWWLWHWSSLARMAETAGFGVEEAMEVCEGRAHALVCRVLPWR